MKTLLLPSRPTHSLVAPKSDAASSFTRRAENRCGQVIRSPRQSPTQAGHSSFVIRHSSFLLSLVFATTLSAQTLSNYQFVVSSQAPSAYFKLDGSLADSVTPSQVFTPSGGFFSADAVRHPTNSYAFLGPADALTLPIDIIPGGDSATNAAAAGKGSISLLFRTLDSSPTGQRFIFSQGTGASSNGIALALFLENNTTTNNPGDLKLRVGSTTTSILLSNAVVYDQWYYFAMTYDEARDSGEVLWYIGRSGGLLASGIMDIGNTAVVGDNGAVTLGNNQFDLASGFRNPGEGRVDEFAVWTRELSTTEVTNQFAQLPNYFPSNVTYQSLISAQLPSHYFKLDGSLVDSIVPSTSVGTNGTTGAYTTNVLGTPNSAYSFSAGDDAIIITNDIVSGGGPAANSGATGVGTISFLFSMLSDVTNTGQRWIFSQGTNTSTTIRDALNLFLENTNINNTDPNSLKLRLGNTTTTLIQPANLMPNAWYYFAIAYDESRDSQSGGEVRWFVGPAGGALATGSFNPANDAVVGDNGWVFLGNRTNLNFGLRNPGSGAIDEFATWSDELSSDEITAQFAAITNVAGPAPSLQITLASPNVLISWPSSTSSSYALEATPSLSPPVAWTNAGAPTVVGGSYFVTNALAPAAQFFRLHKP
jgi:hypothetical protein